MPNTQKGKKAKGNKKKTKRLRGGRNANDSGPTSVVSNSVQKVNRYSPKTVPDTTEDEGSINIKPFRQLSDSTFEITDIPEEAVISNELKTKLTELEGLESTEHIPYTNSKDSSITIGKETTYIDLHALDYSKTLNVDLNVVLNDEQTNDFYTNFNATFEKKEMNPEKLAYLSEHLPLNFFEAVFSSDNLTEVTFKHKEFKTQTEEKEINGIKFKFAKA